MSLRETIESFNRVADEFIKRLYSNDPQPYGYSTPARLLKKPVVKQKPVDPYLQTNLYELDLPLRSHKYFRYLKISTVEQLLEYSYSDLKKLRNIGSVTVNAIQRELKFHGYSLKVISIITLILLFLWSVKDIVVK